MRKTAAITLALLFCHSSSVLQGAQGAPPKTSLATPAKSEAASETGQSAVGANQPVITIQGACEGNRPRDSHGTDCTQTLSRERFESLLDGLNPGGREVSAEARRSLAAAYAQLVAFEIAGRKAGLEDTVKYHEVMNWLRLRTVADFYRHSLQEKYATPSQAEITAYYHQHLAAFEQVHLARILIPREGPAPTDKNEFEKKAAAAAKMARERATKHEDPAKIQNDVYLTLGIKLAPATDMGSLRRSEFTEKEREEVFSLKPGAVSQVETKPMTYVVYIVLGKNILPEDQAKAEIARDISQEKFNHELQSAIDATHAQFNEAYFGGNVTVMDPTSMPMPSRAAGH
jgi:hypothetical protein